MMTHIYKVYRAAASTLLLTAALTAACTDDSREPMQENETPREGIFLSVTATQGEGAETRVSYASDEDGGMNVTWAANDMIYVGKLADGNLNSGILSQLTKSDDTKGTTALFTGEVKEEHLPANGDKLYAFYGKADKIRISGNEIKYYYDGQRQTSNNNMAHLAEYDFMTASTEYDATPGAQHHFSFSHVGSMMKFTLSGLENQTVQQLGLAAYDGSAPFWGITVGSPSVSLALGESNNGITLGADESLVAYKIMAPNTAINEKKLVLYVTTTDGKVFATLLTGANIDPGKLYTVEATLTEYTFEGDGSVEAPYQISGPEDLTHLAIMTNSGAMATEGKNFKLTTNIDMSKQEEWLPIGTDRWLFKGNFSGLEGADSNYSISGLPAKTVDNDTNPKSGLFGRIDGATIENVTVTGDLTLSGTTLYVGGIAGYARSSTIKNCISKRNITVTDNTNSYTGIGGILGYGTTLCTVKNCTNEGAVSSVGKSGGIIGFAQDGNTIDSCKNSGKITATVTGGDAAWTSAGGIIGFLSFNNSGQTFEINECTSSIVAAEKAKWKGDIIGKYTLPMNDNTKIAITVAGETTTITYSSNKGRFGSY